MFEELFSSAYEKQRAMGIDFSENELQLDLQMFSTDDLIGFLVQI